MNDVNYLIKRHLNESKQIEYSTPILADALDRVYSDDDMYRNFGDALSIHKVKKQKEIGSIFELDRYGRCTIDVDNCATAEEVSVIHDIIRVFT